MVNMQDINVLRSRDLDDLLKESWNVRNENFPSVLTISTPSAKTYISDYHKNKSSSFVNISITGTNCTLNCEHCKKNLLENMIPVTNGEELKSLGNQLIEKGCKGVLISGGATSSGEVPLDNYFQALSYLKKLGLKVLVHTGLATQETARKLRQVGVDQVLLDIIGDKETIEKIYHLDKKPSDFLNSMQVLTDNGLDVVPHILIGLNFGQIIGEYNALEMVTRVKPNNIVLVVLSPRKGTPMEGVKTPSANEVGKIAAITRILNQNANISLGCARPPGNEKDTMEKYAIQAGITGIAYPMDETIDYAQQLGLEIVFQDVCCSLL
jgi:uncharacterized radical SAM superfamily protein